MTIANAEIQTLPDDITEEAEAKPVKASTKRTPAKTGKAKPATFKDIIRSAAVQKRFRESFGTADKAASFTTALISNVSANPDLAECDAMTIISAAMTGETLKLSLNPTLGQYYLVPREDRKNGRKVATFLLSWRGYYQLALRTGAYKRLDAAIIKEGELKYYNPITGETIFEPIQDPEAREQAPTIGYYAYFELLNGFVKGIYWPKAKMEAHARRYSAGYRKDMERGTAYTFWAQDFDGMALKTMYRQLIGKYGVMTTDMQIAYAADMSASESLDVSAADRMYVDNNDSAASNNE